jgi:hypothetical protein
MYSPPCCVFQSPLSVAALKAAISTRNPPRGCVHHSYRGSQYASDAYRAILQKHGLAGSMGRRGNPALGYLTPAQYEDGMHPHLELERPGSCRVAGDSTLVGCDGKQLAAVFRIKPL